MTILVIRLSALGDVALLYPEVYGLLQAHPQVKLVILTRKSMKPLFEHLDRVQVFVPELDARHKGFFGLWRLFRDLSKYKIDAVADVHGVLRSAVLRSFFRLSGKRLAVIEKQRKERDELSRKENKIFNQLLTAPERYRKVFSQLGFSYPTHSFPPIVESPAQKRGVGIAPFAGFVQKEWPWKKILRLVEYYSENGVEVWLFGAPGEQREKLKSLTHLPNVHVAETPEGLLGELKLMASLRCMLSMDSANGHLAALVHCPVVTIWGSTHRNFGFAPVGEGSHVEIDPRELTCRPCSAFGAKPCFRGDLACLHRIELKQVVDAVQVYLD
jgi:ADP-heptose:LPS heptosyltransferase